MAEEVIYEDMTVEDLREELSNRGSPGRWKQGGAGRAGWTRTTRTQETVPKRGPEPEEQPDYEEDPTIQQALALEEPLRGLALSLPNGDGVDALKAAVKHAAHGLAHIRKTPGHQRTAGCAMSMNQSSRHPTSTSTDRDQASSQRRGRAARHTGCVPALGRSRCLAPKCNECANAVGGTKYLAWNWQDSCTHDPYVTLTEHPVTTPHLRGRGGGR